MILFVTSSKYTFFTWSKYKITFVPVPSTKYIVPVSITQLLLFNWAKFNFLPITNTNLIYYLFQVQKYKIFFSVLRTKLLFLTGPNTICLLIGNPKLLFYLVPNTKVQNIFLCSKKEITFSSGPNTTFLPF